MAVTRRLLDGCAAVARRWRLFDGYSTVTRRLRGGCATVAVTRRFEPTRRLRITRFVSDERRARRALRAGEEHRVAVAVPVVVDVVPEAVVQRREENPIVRCVRAARQRELRSRGVAKHSATHIVTWVARAAATEAAGVRRSTPPYPPSPYPPYSPSPHALLPTAELAGRQLRNPA